jgi:hypothetical protein
VSGHGFHPPKAQLQGQFPRPQLSGLWGALQLRKRFDRLKLGDTLAKLLTPKEPGV